MTILIAASIIAAGLLILVILFQVLLVLGMPFGAAAWGGEHRILPAYLRFASAMSIILLALVVLIILAGTGMVTLAWRPFVVRIGTWISFCILVLSTLGNLASKSRIERMVMTPVSLICSACVLIVAVSDQS